MPSTRARSFGPERRVRHRREFQQAFDRGQRVQGRYVTVLVAPNQAGRLRLGIVASKKLGGAVQRNRAKRLIRDIFRQAPPLPGDPALDVVVIPRRELLDAVYTSLEADFRSALQRSVTRRARHAG